MKDRLIQLILIMSIGIIGLTCKKPVEDIPPSLDINPTIKNIDVATAGDFTINVTSTVPWTANTTDTWLNVLTKSGEGSGTFKVEFTANATTTIREGSIIVKGNGVDNKTIKVTQIGITLTKPTATTQDATSKTQNSAILNGLINANGQSTTVTFEYGSSTTYGQSITATQSPVSGSTNTNVSATLTGLTENTTYHFRVVATSTAGTTNGNDLTFATTSTPTLSISPTNLDFIANGEAKSVSVTSNTNWNVSSSQSWCKLSQTSGSNIANVNIRLNIILRC